jgi:hypothetical protein
MHSNTRRFDTTIELSTLTNERPRPTGAGGRGANCHSLLLAVGLPVVSQPSLGYTYYQFVFSRLLALKAENLSRLRRAMTSESSMRQVMLTIALEAVIRLQPTGMKDASSY